MREPLETGKVTISRAAHQADYPADFLLLCASNPCHCGHFGNSLGNCRCSPDQIRRYLGKISGPLLDRIDMQVEVPFLTPQQLKQYESQPRKSSRQLQKEVAKAQQIQIARQGKLNGQLSSNELDVYCGLDNSCQQFLYQAIEKLHLSIRSYHRVLKVSRTIADLEQKPSIQIQHLSEALGYRKMEQYLSSF